MASSLVRAWPIAHSPDIHKILRVYVFPLAPASTNEASRGTPPITHPPGGDGQIGSDDEEPPAESGAFSMGFKKPSMFGKGGKKLSTSVERK